MCASRLSSRMGLGRDLVKLSSETKSRTCFVVNRSLGEIDSRSPCNFGKASSSVEYTVSLSVKRNLKGRDTWMPIRAMAVKIGLRISMSRKPRSSMAIPFDVEQLGHSHLVY